MKMYTFCVSKSHFNLIILHYQNQTNSNLTSLLGSVKWLTTTKVTPCKDAFLVFVGKQYRNPTFILEVCY